MSWWDGQQEKCKKWRGGGPGRTPGGPLNGQFCQSIWSVRQWHTGSGQWDRNGSTPELFLWRQSRNKAWKGVCCGQWCQTLHLGQVQRGLWVDFCRQQSRYGQVCLIRQFRLSDVFYKQTEVDWEIWRWRNVWLKAREKNSFQDFRNIIKVGDRTVTRRRIWIQTRFLDKRSNCGMLEHGRKTAFLKWQVS